MDRVTPSMARLDTRSNALIPSTIQVGLCFEPLLPPPKMSVGGGAGADTNEGGGGGGGRPPPKNVSLRGEGAQKNTDYIVLLCLPWRRS